MSCWPWFHEPYSALNAQAWTKTVIPSGCGPAGSDGNIPCSPESMRAASEAWLAKNYPQVLSDIGGRLPLDMYTYARYMATEALGNKSTVEERVATGEALRNHVAKIGKTLYNSLTPGGFYGPIHAKDEWCIANGRAPASAPNCEGKHNACCAPYNRWAATTNSPSIMTLLLAHLVVTGQSGDFAQGADDQAAVHTASWVQYLAKNGSYWVGPLPGVDHYRTFLVRKVDAVTKAVAGKALLQRGLDALGKPPVWPPLSETCSKPAVIVSRRTQAFLLSALGLAIGSVAASFVTKKYARPV